MNKSKIIEFLNKKRMFFIGFIALIPILFCIDIYTKRLAFSTVDLISIKTVGVHNRVRVNDYFNIVRVINTGVSFGMFNKLANGALVLSMITIIILLFVAYLLWKTEKSYYDLFAYSFIIAGGLGNLFDRVKYGGVYDFLDFHISSYHWPAFNVADSLICVAVFMIIIKDVVLFFKNKKTKN